MIKIKVKYLKSTKEKSIGLIGNKNITPVYFETRFGIHTFGVLEQIDILILNKNNKVVKIKNSLKPNSFFFWNPKYTKVVELKNNEIKKLGITLNNVLILEYAD
ncbi:hypothetical protein BH10PAT1_BH10PAT1_5360 [soil metagenome]